MCCGMEMAKEKKKRCVTCALRRQSCFCAIGPFSINTFCFLAFLYLLLVIRRIEGGELFDRVIDDDFVLTEKACVAFVRQVCQAMEFIHHNKIIHLDLKPENILCITREGNRIKIIDFGLARKYDPDKKLQVIYCNMSYIITVNTLGHLLMHGTTKISCSV